ncbi:UDP-N-acetylmuramate--L-alanine ligase [Salinibacterium sp. NSLL150]|uniref:UDP-N-acetylmuramate--L-alanine ligase n=1 Tax=unclassified Salinibacterium TaxID=2632331 RepID=UPI0018CD3ADB|nr:MULTISPECIES: UDP-N-acetylmuramate--L-alanine ligase [unclassified Salinibacterium]MBH0099252.1 UDP-N-acetylmuramate--L-alanine ligase [Salinibacterium sp. NSLL35]MBH0102006.1 UDP-N-acetylmuramate--L-alanine ligase [Salinibacterium sp. NSLL150]MBH0104766.1 UDP-N-acetylmuramate--L-alanine ligase [Salinibacterium sp. NSLL16]MBH0107526.1 UDP-N-acetylmuramate--L-alanine ligase [Salinibacterium sp. NSLL17]
MIFPDLSMPLPGPLRSAHFVGVGGAGMSGIAQMFLDAGITVTGSDKAANANTASLNAAGATISIGHDAAHLGEAEALVYTGALWPDNPEYLAALERGIPVLHRSQALAWLVGSTRLVAVAGAHGKTTSTGMIITALRELGTSPSFVNGGVIQGLGTSSGSGTDDLFVVEADESDGSFLLYSTAVALITNVDADHLDHYGSHEAFDDAFVEFASRATEAVVVSSDDAGAIRVTKRLTHDNVVTFGEADDATVRIHSVTSLGPVAFTVVVDGREERVQLAVPGHHNALNAAGAIAVLIGLGHELGAAIDSVSTFAGTQRRFELHAVVDGVSVYDDYAHHPTEVEAALSGARSVLGNGRLIAVHQPHLFSRTRDMAPEFAEVYERLADHTVVLGVFGAREDPIPGVTGELVSSGFVDPSRVDYQPDWELAAQRVAEIAQEGDIVMTLSCGDVYRIIPQLVAAIDRYPVVEASETVADQVPSEEA